MKKWRLSPWTKIEFHDQSLKLFRTTFEKDLLEEFPIRGNWGSHLIDDQSIIDWETLISHTDSLAEIESIKSTWSKMKKNECLLEFFSDEIWAFKKDFPQIPEKNILSWKGWPDEVNIAKDKNEGWWIDVPGALLSLWAQNLQSLQTILDHPTEDQKKLLAANKFDGSYLPDDVKSGSSMQDWLWWEGVHFNGRHGILARTRPAKISPQKYPDGTLIGPLSIAYPLPNRTSIRGHETREALELQELINILGTYFDYTGKSSSEWHVTPRQYGPSAGGVYDSTVWVLAVDVEGLEAGLYCYDGLEHKLKKYSLAPELEQIWKARAQKAWGPSSGVPQAVISVVSDLSVVYRKYQRLSMPLAIQNATYRIAELQTLADKNGLATCLIAGGTMKELASTWGGNCLLVTPLAEMCIGGKAQKKTQA